MSIEFMRSLPPATAPSNSRSFIPPSGGPAGASSPRAMAVRPLRFVLVFACCFLLSFGLLLTPPAQYLDGRFSRALVRVSHGLITLCSGKARVEGPVLRDPASGFAVEMKDGCNAVNVTILLWSALLAFPARWKSKLWGALAGSLIIQALNLVRFISLFYIGQYSMTWFDFAHGYLWESLLVLDTMVVFWLWVDRVSRSGAVADAVR
jgi:exosortase H (IPTLxxWG-CTERM-specific)